MVRKILTYPEDRETLSLKSMKVQDINNEETKQAIQDLRDTLKTTGNGKGMSAIQIGYPLQICICLNFLMPTFLYSFHSVCSFDNIKT